MSSADPLVRENETVAGKYVIGRTLGEGGMGVVVAARHLELDQMVAIKFLRPEIAQEGSAAERFRREARAAVKIRSEHVCRVLDVGTLGNGVPYLVMEYLEGCDLSDEVTQRGQLPIEEAVDYVLQACEALAEAHAAGIVHRDLKPGNLFLEIRRDGTRGIKVLDFGVSKSVIEGSAQLRLTKTASLVGSPLYMSPEQLDAAKDVDPRADIWALATILFELIAGKTPFYAETIPQLVHAVMSGSPPPFVDIGIAVPEALEQAILRSLSKQRADRHQSIAEFARALAPFGPAHSIVSVLRTERVLATTGGLSGPLPLGSAAASGPWRTPNPASLHKDTITERTMDVSSRPATGATPAPWGRSGEEGPRKLRRGLVVTVTALSVGSLAVVIALLLVRGRSETPEDATAASGAAAAPFGPTGSAVRLEGERRKNEVEPSQAAVQPFTAKASVPPAASDTPPAEGAREPTPRKTAVTRPPALSGRGHAGNARTGSSAVALPPPVSPSEGISDFGGRR